MNSSAATANYLKMQDKILKDDKATCYLVQVIAKHSVDEPWVISLKGIQYNHYRIRKISIDKFYNLVFGEPDCFMRLCKALPNILNDIIQDMPSAKLTNTVLDELGVLNQDIFRSLYLLAFSTYEGFSNF